MAWRAIPGFLASDFWFPATTNHVVEPVEPEFSPSGACQTRCEATPTCCRWGVRSVRSWEDAKDVADGGLTHLGWVISGESYHDFAGPLQWCAGAKCAGAHLDDLFTIEIDTANKQMTFKDGTKEGTVELLNLPGGAGATSFYALVIVNSKGYEIYNQDGTLQWSSEKTAAVNTLISDPWKDPSKVSEVTFVTSYSCGLFQEVPSGSGFSSQESLYRLGTCGNRKWSDDTSAGLHGISFANIACAVFASVALVFVVLFVTKKNSHPEVAVADEQAQLL